MSERYVAGPGGFHTQKQPVLGPGKFRAQISGVVRTGRCVTQCVTNSLRRRSASSPGSNRRPDPATPGRSRAGEWQALCTHGGFPEPFLRRDPRFSRRWRSLRKEQLSREDLRDVAHVQDLGAMEMLMAILAERSSHQLVYAALANEINVSVDTVKRWIDILGRLHYGFTIRPWFRNVTKALRKEPRWCLRDWSGVADPGDRDETMVGCHLLKAVEGWTDLGFGDFELRYLRDTTKREVDFVVVRDGKPWFLVGTPTGAVEGRDPEVGG